VVVEPNMGTKPLIAKQVEIIKIVLEETIA
jgi:hypothetical protein